MKKCFLIICLASVLCLTSGSVWGFGGGGGRTHKYYQRHNPGVDSIGVHRHTDGHQGDFCLFDLTNDPNAEEVQTGVFHCKGGSILDCDTGICTLCPAGTYAAAEDESCSTTPAGYYTPEGASEPIPCPDGTYQPQEGQAECLEVTPGYEPAVPTPDDEVPCTDTTTKGACGCASNEYADGTGHCVPDKCANVWINECTPSCTQAGGPQKLANGTACQDSLGTCQNGVCCQDGTCATQNKPELYCEYTNDDGQCGLWRTCQAGMSTTNKIVDIPNASGACGNNTYPELYCLYTNDAGQCISWSSCQAGMSTTNKIVDLPNASGVCGDNTYPELYCDHTNDQGQCESWGACQAGMSSTDKIVDVPDALGTCGHDEYSEVYCSTTNNDGKCTSWSTCPEGKSSKDWIVDVPNAYGVCAWNEFPEVYCLSTNTQGKCTIWDICEEGKSTKDWIVETANATGSCCDEGLIPQHDGTCCPANATCDGDNIVCNSGYSLFDNECITNDCPGDHQWKRASEDYCKDCSTPTEPQSATTVEDCIGKCVGYRYVGTNQQGAPKCWNCGAPNYSVSITPSTHEKTESSCNACLNRYYSNGHCVCDSDHAYDNNTKCCPPGQHANSAKTGCVDDSTTEDVTDCTGKADGTVCSNNTDVSEDQRPVCIDGNCDCLYTEMQYESEEGMCIYLDGDSVSCNRLTQREAVCKYVAEIQAFDFTCIDKNSSFTPIIPHCIHGYKCISTDETTGCCAEYSCMDVTDCTGKDDGVVCSATNPSLLENPSRQLPICINKNCECPYENDTLDMNEGVCIQKPDGWGEASCHKLTQKAVPCTLGGDGQFVQYACVDKNSTFKGAEIGPCPTLANATFSWECAGSVTEGATTCCAEIECIATPISTETDGFEYYDGNGTKRTIAWCDESERTVALRTWTAGVWGTQCVDSNYVVNVCGSAAGGVCMGDGSHGYMGICPDEAVQSDGNCIDPAAIQPMGELPS